VPAVEQLLRDNTLERFRANTAALENRAVFEIPDMLLEILAGSAATPAPQTQAAKCR